MTKIVINKCYGGFGLSEEAQMEWFKRKGKTVYLYSTRSDTIKQPMYIPKEEFEKIEAEKDKKALDQYYAYSDLPYGSLMRTDHDLVAIVEEWGVKAYGEYAQLCVVNIPDDVVEWEITEYDGIETIREKHRSW